MSQPKTKGRRGFTIAEVLTVSVIMGFVSTFVALIVGPLFASINQQGAKVDTLQAAVRSFYRIQRDLHQSNVNGVFVCTYATPTVCSVPSQGALADATVIAIISAKANGTGQLSWDGTQGQPQWTGFNVYWLARDASGVMSLNYSFNNPGGAQASIASADAAVNNALKATPQFLATSVTGLQVNQNAPATRIGLKMFATSTEGKSTNETSFESDTMTRN
jgi:prepilin-type N-terminal cleavage/methylation domain-containing protein